MTCTPLGKLPFISYSMISAQTRISRAQNAFPMGRGFWTHMCATPAGWDSGWGFSTRFLAFPLLLLFLKIYCDSSKYYVQLILTVFIHLCLVHMSLAVGCPSEGPPHLGPPTEMGFWLKIVPHHQKLGRGILSQIMAASRPQLKA